MALVMAENERLRATVDSHQSMLEEVLRQGGSRRLQGTEPEPEPAGVDLVRIHQRKLSSEAAGKSVENGHRRALQTPAVCGVDDLGARLGILSHECCDEPTEDCSTGYPGSSRATLPCPS
jgi:hypothetical protein